MAWNPLEPNAIHLTAIILPAFLLLYALLSLLIRNTLHMSEPPLATLYGVVFGPSSLSLLKPYDWGLKGSHLQELTRVIAGIQCFIIGLELPPRYFSQPGILKSMAMLLVPAMFFSWIICAAFIMLLFSTSAATALIISACLTPTDPVLASSMLANSQFSTRVPKRIRDLLSAESGCNDGMSFPFLYLGIYMLGRSSVSTIFSKWALQTILYQCLAGSLVGILLGLASNFLFRFCTQRKWMEKPSHLTFYLLLSWFSIGIASSLGLDDFLVTFFAGIGFSYRGNIPTRNSNLPVIIDLLLNSTLFVFFGAVIPWEDFKGNTVEEAQGILTPGRLVTLLGLILLFRRIPILFILHRFHAIPTIQTSTEALFCGHFGPMGVGALFLAMEARARLESDSRIILPSPPSSLPAEKRRAVALIWPIVCFVVFGSTMVHGLSTLAISVAGHWSRRDEERAPLIGAETEGFWGMRFDDEDRKRRREFAREEFDDEDEEGE